MKANCPKCNRFVLETLAPSVFTLKKKCNSCGSLLFVIGDANGVTVDVLCQRRRITK